MGKDDKSSKNCIKNCFYSSRHLQQLVYLACFLVTVSLVLNIWALRMISLIRDQEQKTKIEFNRHFEEQDQKASKMSSEIFSTIGNLKNEIWKKFDAIDEKANEAELATKQLKKKLDQSKQRINRLEKKLKQDWRKGCPEHGLTNGTLCYVLNNKKKNFTSASENCKSKGGFLARIPNLQILDEVTRVFPKSPFFVDGRFNHTSEKWLTSDGSEASYLPWKLNQAQSAGDCVYAYRSGYKTWHCSALFDYLCEF